MKRGVTHLQDTKEYPMPDPNELREASQTKDLLQRILDELKSEAGLFPQFKCYEFELEAGDRHTITADFETDRWVIWTRRTTDAGDVIRLMVGTDVPNWTGAAVLRTPTQIGAVEMYAARRCIIGGRQQSISFHNPNSTNTLHVFCVAAAATDFDIETLPWSVTQV